jgi:isoaspartyl peptidase/L-asparaginase-like protein (Ntn-hydrolase superfamily)
MRLLVHGGAGSEPAEPEPRQATLDLAHEAGLDAGTPVAAVRSAIRELEADPRFNAGRGGAVQDDGVVRTDAGLMTASGDCGAACAMPGVEHAVDVARAVADRTPHVLLAGPEAITFADAVGVDTDRDLLTAKTETRYGDADPPGRQAGLTHRLEWICEHFGGTDTVGAVATDGDRLAAATSTAGRWFALAGRVGDVPQVGAGFYASEAAAASATGEGEAIARFGLARRVGDAVANGEGPQEAADRVLRGFEDETGGRAGVIVVDREGRGGRASNAERMQTAGPTD